jgi:hypothetical protein
VVERHSAALNIENEDQIDMEKNHSTICKYGSRDEDQYQRVEAHLIDLFEWAATKGHKLQPTTPMPGSGINDVASQWDAYPLRKQTTRSSGFDSDITSERSFSDVTSVVSSDQSDGYTTDEDPLMAQDIDESPSSGLLSTFGWLRMPRKRERSAPNSRAASQVRWPIGSVNR